MPLQSPGKREISSDSLVQRFRRHGVLLDAGQVSAESLQMLREICGQLLAEPVDDGGKNGRLRLGLGDARRFLAHRHCDFPSLRDFVLSGSPARLAARLFGGPCHLFNEQFVVKGAATGASFAWHQDGAYVGFTHRPYLSVWIALDDATPANGCLYVLRRDLDQESHLDPHQWLAGSRELIGYSGGDQGIPVLCAAGGMIAFSSLTLHRSGENRSAGARRAYLVQYSPEVIRHPETGEAKRFFARVAV